MSGLILAPNLRLPLEGATQAIAILGRRGSGKTVTASVLAEELLKSGLQVVILDPLDVWFGLRSSANGAGSGLPIVVCGGSHADVPLDPSMARSIADVVVEDHMSAILSLRHMSKSDQRRLVTDFCERIYARKGETSYREPLHIIIDEADSYTPQRVQAGQERMLGSIDDIVRRGRASGLGVTLISQRPAVVHKDVLTQCETLICHRTVSPQDRKALEAWIEAHDAEGQRGEFMSTLASLPIGTAWVWSPGWLGIFEKVAIRPRETFDSSATPKVGQAAVAPAVFAPVDLDLLRGRLEQAVERAAADDPKVLRARIAELERTNRTHLAPAEPVVERIEVSVLTEADWRRLDATLDRFDDAASAVLAMGRELRETVGAVMTAAKPAPARPIQMATTRRLDEPAATPARGLQSASDAPHLRAGERKMLAVLAQHPAGLTRQQLATLSRFSVKGGTFGTYIGTIKRAGLVAEEGGIITLTDGGLAALGDEAMAPPATTEEILAIWRGELRAGERAMLDELVRAYPGSLSKVELAEITGFTVTGGTFSTYLGVLRRNGLIEVNGGEVTASSTLFLGER